MTEIISVDHKGVPVGSGTVNLQDPRSGVHYKGPLLEFTDLRSGDTLVSAKQNNGDWDYYWVIESTDWVDATGDTSQLYVVSVSVVAPQAVDKKVRKSAMNSSGSEEWLQDIRKGPEGRERAALAVVEILHDYGTRACIAELKGGDPDLEDEDEEAVLADLVEQAKKIATVGTSIAFGFWMDRPMNAFGNTGWDFVAGKIGP